jgi:hypothetical protein
MCITCEGGLPYAAECVLLLHGSMGFFNYFNYSLQCFVSAPQENMWGACASFVGEQLRKLNPKTHELWSNVPPCLVHHSPVETEAFAYRTLGG